MSTANNTQTSLAAPTATGPLPLTPTQAIDALWKVIGRYDTYIGSTNTKAAMLIAFNTFVPGSIALKWKDIQDAFGSGHKEAFILASIFLLIALVASVVSLVFTFWAISPFLKSPEPPGGYVSDVFFGSVGRHENPEAYLARVESWSDSAFRKDLAIQAHTLAQGLSAKFYRLKVAISAVMFAQLPMFGAMILTYLCVVLSDVIRKTATP